MATLEPRRIDIRDVVHWWKAAFDLLNRRLVFYAVVMLSYCVVVYFGMRAFVSISYYLPLLALSVVFLLFTAFLLYFALACFVVIAHCADKSQHLTVNRLLSVLIPEQRTLVRMAGLALLVGLAIWVLSLSLDSQRNVIAGGEAVMEKMISSQEDPSEYILQITAAMLYFLLLSLYALRIFFSIPLVVFHELSYVEARQLSQRGIILNIVPMSAVLLTWALLLLTAARGAYIVAAVLFPLLGSFIYVSYRHIFIGQWENDKGHKVVRESLEEATVNAKK